MRTLAPAVLALAVIACTELPEIEPSSCGNLVLDPGEDCDGFSAFEGAGCGGPGTSAACAYVCDADVSCPTGFRCGVGDDGQGRCAAPSDGYAATVGPVPFRADAIAVGDVDGDGLNDLIGNSQSTISVLFGSRGASFPTRLEVSVPSLTGEIVYGRFDADGTTDAVAPVTSGLFTLRGRPERALDPVPYAPFDLSSADAKGTIRLLSVDIDADRVNDDLLILAENDDCDPTSGVMAVFESGGDVVTLPDGFLTSQIPGQIPISTSGAAPRLALSFRDDSRADDNRVWVYDLQSVISPGGWRLRFSPPVVVCALGTLPGGACRPGGVFNGTLFADSNGDGIDDLFLSVREPPPAGNLRTLVALGTPDGGFLEPIAPFDDPGVDDDDEPWPIAAGQINGDAIADYVFPQGVLVTDGKTLQFPAVPATQLWSDARLLDINADGRADVVAISENEPGVDIFLNTGTDHFNRFRVNTDDPITLLRSGDFDGDLVGDLALVESGFGANPDHVSVIFGEALGAPSEPVSMGFLDEIEAMETTSFGLAVDAFDDVADLAVVSAPPTEEGCADGGGRPPRVAAILQGSSSRRMLSPFTLKEPATVLPDRPLAAVVGHFMNADTLDVIAIAEIVPRLETGGGQDSPDPFEGDARVYGIPGKGIDGDLDAGGQVVGTPFPPGVFAFRCSVWTAGDLDPGAAAPGSAGFDEVVGLDQTALCGNGGGFSAPPRLVIVRVDDGVDPMPIDLGGLPVPLTVPIELKLVDLDGDLDNDILVAFLGEYRAASAGSGAEPGPSANGGLLILWNQDGEFSPADATTLTVPSASPFDVDIIDEGGAHPTVVALGQDAVYRSHFDDDTGEMTALEAYLGNPNFCTRLEVGDVSGDGLPDLVVANDFEVYALLQSPASPLGGSLDDGVVVPVAAGDSP